MKSIGLKTKKVLQRTKYIYRDRQTRDNTLKTVYGTPFNFVDRSIMSKSLNLNYNEAS